VGWDPTMESRTDNNTCKICILGDGGVGKSAITLQFIEGRFVEGYDPTIEDRYRKQVVVDDEACLLEMLDTAGQEAWCGGDVYSDQWIRDAEGFIVVYSITSRPSFEEVPRIRDRIVRLKGTDHLSVVLVANKCDLELERVVSAQEGSDSARVLGALFKEVSAKAWINIDEAFSDVIRMIRQCRCSSMEADQSSGTSCCLDWIALIHNLTAQEVEEKFLVLSPSRLRRHRVA